MVIATGGYGLAYWGICLVKGKDVTLIQMFNPAGHYPGLAGPFSRWPAAPPSQVFPSGTGAKGAGGGRGTARGGGSTAGRSGGARPQVTPGPGTPNPHGFVQ
jgi:hypothetical protein